MKKSFKETSKNIGGGHLLNEARAKAIVGFSNEMGVLYLSKNKYPRYNY